MNCPIQKTNISGTREDNEPWVLGRKSHGCPVQRCLNHKAKNVCDRLSDELALRVRSVMKAAYKLPWKEGINCLKKHAACLKVYCPGTAVSLLEGLEETFAINRLELLASLCRRLPSTNIIESY